jgi:hypothetical protein
MCLRSLYPSANYTDAPSRSSKYQFHQILTSLSPNTSLLAKQPSHERRTVHRAPALVQEADLCSLYTCAEFNFGDKHRRAPFTVT